MASDEELQRGIGLFERLIARNAERAESLRQADDEHVGIFARLTERRAALAARDLEQERGLLATIRRMIGL